MLKRFWYKNWRLASLSLANEIEYTIIFVLNVGLIKHVGYGTWHSFSSIHIASWWREAMPKSMRVRDSVFVGLPVLYVLTTESILPF